MRIEYKGRTDKRINDRCAVIAYRDSEESLAEELRSVLESIGYLVDDFWDGKDTGWLMVSVWDRDEYEELLEEYKGFKKYHKKIDLGY